MTLYRPSDKKLDFGIVTGQHWRSWDTISAQWQWAEETGWESAWVFDHFYSLRPTDDGDCLEGWTLLAALAAQTRRIRIGALVSGITHRLPSVLFKQSVTVDHISGGRLILGVGAAWNEPEHNAYGIPFPAPRDRVDMFGEAMEMNRLLETQERTSFEGEFYSLVDAPFEPKPVYGHIPVMVGSSGKRMMRHIARYADLWDSGQTPERTAALSDEMDELCRDFGRNPAEIRRAISAYYGPASNPDAPVIIWEQSQTEVVDAITAHVRSYAAAGVRTFLFNVDTDAPNSNHDYVARQLLPELRAAFAAGALI